MGALLTALDVGQRIGEPPEHIEQWRAQGLLGAGEAGGYRTEDVERARLIQYLLRRGVDLPTIVHADREENLLARRIEETFPQGVGPMFSLAEVAEQVGLERDLVRRLLAAAELAEQRELLHEHDVEAVRVLKAALDAGIPEEALLQVVRVYADALGRVADAEARLFHYYVHERMKGRGIAGRNLLDAVGAAGNRVRPVSEAMIRYFHAKGWEKALREGAVVHAREHAGLWEQTAVPGQLHAAITFVDLSGFTSLAEAMGDETAVRVLARFSEIVREATSRFDGSVVKQIGDAFMLMFPDAGAAVACALEIERSTATEPHFPAVRTGIHWGQVLYREGDYFGTTVNVAARLAAQAQRHELLVTEATRAAADAVADVVFQPLGARRFRGLTEPIDVYAVLPRHAAEPRARLIDPACGMELYRDEAVAVLVIDGREHAFCSQECLRRFVP